MAATDHASYLAALPPDQRKALEDLRMRLQARLPDADEGMSYGMPCFRVGGKPAIGFGAAKAHLSLYPFSGQVLSRVAERLGGLNWSKGAINFQPDQPLPDDVIDAVLQARLAEISS